MRRFFDYLLPQALQEILPNKTYPAAVQEYLEWDDHRVWQEMKAQAQQGGDVCQYVVERNIYPCVFHTKVHPADADIQIYNIARRQLYDAIGKTNIVEDDSATKMPHGIPRRTEISDEKAVVIVSDRENRVTTISNESNIMQALTDRINICRIYVKPDFRTQAENIIKRLNKPLS